MPQVVYLLPNILGLCKACRAFMKPIAWVLWKAPSLGASCSPFLGCLIMPLASRFYEASCLSVYEAPDHFPNPLTYITKYLLLGSERHAQVSTEVTYYCYLPWDGVSLQKQFPRKYAKSPDLHRKVIFPNPHPLCSWGRRYIHIKCLL